jgi:nitrite reductase/ring-hydroxylating ferredoxin subunit
VTVWGITVEYIKITSFSSLNNKDFISLSILGKRIGIFKNSDGTLLVTETGCKHQGADITQGKRDGDVFTCPRHGWKYDIRTGKCLNHDSFRLRKYNYIIEGDAIKISLVPKEYD